MFDNNHSCQVKKLKKGKKKQNKDESLDLTARNQVNNKDTNKEKVKVSVMDYMNVNEGQDRKSQKNKKRARKDISIKNKLDMMLEGIN